MLLGSQPLASAFAYARLNWASLILDETTHLSILYNGVGILLLSLLAAVAYVRNLDPAALSRPSWLVYLNAFAPGLFCAMELVAWDLGENTGRPSLYSLAAAPALAFVPPLLLVLLESAIHRLCQKLGHLAAERGWRRTALRLLRISLSLRPGNLDIQRQCALLYIEEDDFDRTLALLEPLGPVSAMEDGPCIRALERSYRLRGNIREALNCLLRLQQLGTESASIDRRILDDYIKLGLTQDALDLLESGRLKPTMDLLLLRQQLNVEQGNYAQAMAQIQHIAEQEGPLHDQSIRLYRDLSRLLPDNMEVRINMGRLLLDDEMEGRRREGAALLEDVLAQDPHRLHLARCLAQYYVESGNPTKVREHLERLVAAGDPNPDYYFSFAQMLLEEEQYAEAVKVLQRITDLIPEDWRGHLRLARVYFLQNDLDRAEAALNRTITLAPDASDPSIRNLCASIEQRQRERQLTTLAEDTSWDRTDAQKTLQLIEHMIDMEWFDKALGECDSLLESSPDLLPEVERLIQKGIALTGRNYLLRDYLSDLYLQQGRFNEMLPLYHEMAALSLHPSQVMIDGCRKILERDPDYLEARRELALARRDQEDWAGILEALGPVLRQDADGTARMAGEDKALWVEAAYRLRRLEDAARVGLSLTDELAAETGFMLMMIDLFQEQGDFDHALEVFWKAKMAAPHNERLRRMERRVVNGQKEYRLTALQRRLQHGVLTPADHFEMAELQRELGQLEDAIIHYQRAADDPALADLATAKMAVALCDRGMFDVAEETLGSLELTRESVNEHPEIKDLMYSVARSLEKIRRPELALKYYRRIFRVDASYEDVVDRLDRLS